jgi:hypothetical protein
MLLVLIPGSLSPIDVDYHSSKLLKTLPFVCRLKDAKAGKSKQNVIEISNSAESVKANR